METRGRLYGKMEKRLGGCIEEARPLTGIAFETLIGHVGGRVHTERSRIESRLFCTVEIMLNDSRCNRENTASAIDRSDVIICSSECAGYRRAFSGNLLAV